MKRVSNKIPFYQFDLLRQFDKYLSHAVFTRHGGLSKPPFDSLNVRFGIGDSDDAVWANRENVCDALGVKLERVISANQTHSKNVYIHMKGDPLPEPREVDDVDILITNAPKVVLMTQVADCQAVLLFDEENYVIANVHAGWKGSVKNVIGEAVDTMKEVFGSKPEEIVACISPSLGPCCSEFTDPTSELPKEFHKYILPENKVDFWQASIDQLREKGVKEENIEVARICTSDHSDEFFSHRKENGKTGRFAVTIHLL